MLYLIGHNHVAGEIRTSVLMPMRRPAFRQRLQSILFGFAGECSGQRRVHLGVGRGTRPFWLCEENQS